MTRYKTAYLVLSLLLGQGATLGVPIMLLYGLGQFHLMNQLGPERALSAFGYGTGLINLCLLATNPWMGHWVDRLRRQGHSHRYAILLGSGLGGLALLGFAHASQLLQIYGCWIALSLGYGLASLGLAAVLPERLTTLALQRASGLLGASIPLVIMLLSLLILVGLGSWPLPHKFLALVMLQWLCVALALVGITPASEPPAIQPASEPPTRTSPDQRGDYRQYRLVLLGSFLLHLCTAGMSLMSLYYIARFALSQEQALRLNGLLAAGVLLLLGSGASSVYLTERWGKQKPWLLLGALLLSLSLIGQAYATRLGETIACSLLTQLALGICYSQGLALLNRNLPDRAHLGRDIAWFNAAKQAGSALVHFLAPTLILMGHHWLGDDGYTLYFLLLAACALLYLITLLQVRDLSPRLHPPIPPPRR